MAVQRDLISLTLAAVAAVVVAAVGLPSQGCPSPDGGGLQYTVGDSDWTLPPTADYYTNWSSSHFFKIGDSLVFKFEKWRYNVVQVTKQDYESCTAYKPLKVFNSGPVNISLPEKGVFYFICYISNYCSLGMKISITVHDCPSCIEPPSSPSPSPSPPPPASPALVPPPSSPPSRSAQPPSQGNPAGPAFQPPVQVTSPAPSPVNSSPEAPSNSGALDHKGMLGVGSYELFFGLFLVVVVFG